MATPSGLIEIDGSHGEGGGALLRAALVMSTITQQPVKINQIRTSTRFPGLDIEDLTILKALAKMCSADYGSATPGSESLTYVPHHAPRKIEGVIPSEKNDAGRGANALVVLSTLLPVLCRTGAFVELSAEGETYGRGSLSYDYFTRVTLHALRAMNVAVFSDLQRAAYSREEVGEVKLDIEPCQFEGLRWTERGRADILRATVTTTRMDSAIAGRAISHLERLAQSSKMQIDVERIEADGSSPGVYITVWASFAKGIGGGGSIGQRGVRVETVAQQAFDQCLDWITADATLDPFVGEHVILPACLAQSPSEFKVSELTPRLLTTIWVVKQFTPIRIVVRGSEAGAGTISVNPAE